MKRSALRAAFPHTIPVMTGYVFMGMAFGILLKSKGYHVGWAFLMSTFIFAGSMQFVAINLLTSGFNLATTALMTLMVNARHLFYGLSMLEAYKDMGKKRPYMIFALTDETFSLLCTAQPPADVNKKWFMFFIAALDQSYWVIGSVAGSLLGTLIHFQTKGIDFVMTALFVVIFIDQWRGNSKHIAALTGIGVSLTCLMLFGSVNFIIPSMIGILTILVILRKPIERGDR